MKKTLFLNPPSYEGFDGGAGSRYQARREIRSFWYPTWLAQPAAMVPGSRLIDAPPDGLTVEQVAPLARDYELAVLHTSTPSFSNDARFAARLKEENPRIEIGMVGAHVGVLPMQSLQGAPAVDWVAVGEFDYTCAEIAEGRPLHEVGGIAYRQDGQIRFTAPRATIENMDAMPSVIEVYKRDLTIENYFIGYLQHPYVSLYTGRGCRSKCTFCLWPQTLGGHRYRVRSADSVEAEMTLAKKYFPNVKEFFFDDDTFTDDLPRAEEIARRLGRLGITWSCNAKAIVPRKTLEILRENGLRLLLVGYESGNQQILNNIKKGTRIDLAREFTRNARELGITIHGTFILGLPGETPETIRETIRFACEIEPETIQVSLAAPYPGTELYRQAQEQGWLEIQTGELVDSHGVQIAALNFQNLSSTVIFNSVEDFYRKFYFRPRKIFSMVGGMLRSPEVMRRRLREGVEFFRFLHERKETPGPALVSAGETPQSILRPLTRHKMRRAAILKTKTYILLFLMVAFGSVGNTLLDKGMKHNGSLDLSTRSALWAGLVHTFGNGTICLGILCMLAFMVCHMLVLSWADYSFVMPFSAVAYALVPLLGYVWLGEAVHATRWMGIGLIVFGVYLISRTPPSTSQPDWETGRGAVPR